MKELTPKEAIKILHPDTSRDALWKIEYYAGFNAEKARLKAVEDACLVACEALEKQIPKKPDLEGDGYADGHLVYDTWICPCCEKHYEVDYDDYDYCPNCGQAIDWSE